MNERTLNRGPGLAANVDFALADRLQESLRPGGPARQALSDLATEVIQRHINQGRRGLAICGASFGTGVTITAASLSVALAEAGVSTILVEANLRRPSLDTLIIPTSPRPGLAQHLRGDVDRYAAINFDVLDNLAVVFAGGAADDADQLLASRRFQEFVDTGMRDFHCMIVDTPPANRYADVRAIAAAVGYAAIVARRRFSFVQDTQLLSRQLADDGVVTVGSIFNRG